MAPASGSKSKGRKAAPSSKSTSRAQSEASSTAPAQATALNPTTDFAGFVDNMTKALEASTSASAQFPDKSDLGFHRTLDRKFAKGLDATGQRVLDLTDKLLQLAVEGSQEKTKAAGGKVKPRRKVTDEDDVVDSFQATVIEPVDALLEDADTNLDEVNGKKQKAAIDIKPSLAAKAGQKLPGPFSQTSQARLPTHLFNAPGIAKPQLLFKDAVDNSPDARWSPTLPVKEHAMVPLGHKISEDDSWPMGELDEDPKKVAARRDKITKFEQHPYYYETRHLPYPTSMFMLSAPVRPRSFEDTPFEFIDTPDRLAVLTETLKKAKEIAVDLEHHNQRSYYGFTCLMQISTREGDWIIDTLALRAELREHKLGHVFADPSIVKVFHGADSDIVWLQEDFDIYIVNLFDTYHATKVLEFPKFSLASLLQLYCDFEPDKRYQMADWRIRPIPEEMMKYARSDTHFLLYIYDNLRNALIARASRTPSPSVEGQTPKPNPQRAMRRVLDLSSETALKLYQRDGYDPEKGQGMNGWANLSKKLGKKEVMKEEVGWVFKALHQWRDTLARGLDESPHYVLSNQVLIQLSHLRPNNASVLARTLVHQSAEAYARADEIAEVIKNAAAAFRARSPSKSPSKSLTPLSGTTSRAQSTAAPVKKPTKAGPVIDVWSSIETGATAPGAPSSSALFGSTLSKKKASSPMKSSKKASSSLFGNTLSAPSSGRSSRKGSPGFSAVQSSIFSALAPTVAAPKVEVEAPGSSLPAPETVPFVPAANRKNATSDQTTTATTTKKSAQPAETKAEVEVATSGAPKATVDDDGIVSVKKKKAKKPKKASPSPATDGAEAPSSDVKSEKKKPVKKQKVKAGDIPTFSYENEANLLDEPAKAATNQRKAKKAKHDTKGDSKKKTGIDTSAFRRPAPDATAPKSGNRSGTFM